jgi:hypothetical protein
MGPDFPSLEDMSYEETRHSPKAHSTEHCHCFSPCEPKAAAMENESSGATKREHEVLKAQSATDSTPLVSIDRSIDEIARQALEHARRIEEEEKFRRHPGPIVAPGATKTWDNSFD